MKRNVELKSVIRRASAILIGILVVVSCGDNSSTTDTTQASSTGILKGVCPDTVVIQTDWSPQAEHGFVYYLVGPGYTFDTDTLALTGPLYSNNEPTGVNVQINVGGPVSGSDPVISRLHSDPDILLAFMGTDIALSKSQDFPTVSVVAPFNINPQIIMWDPATYPEVRTISELKDADVRVLYFRNVAYMKYLVTAGILSENQVDDSYEGYPDQFVAANGKVAQQGYGTNEPFYYENKLEQWKKTVRYQYIHETGWSPYAQSLATTPQKMSENDECLKKLVPIIQQSTVDYVLDPTAANELIVEAVNTYATGNQYDIEQAAASADKQLTDRLISNSPDGTLGSFDLDRVQAFIDLALPIYTERGDLVKGGIAASDLATNQYIDPTISLPVETAG